MKNESLEIELLLRSIWKNKKIIFSILVASVIAFEGATFFITKQFKSKAVISIYNKYFQTMLVKDVTPQTNDLSEMRSQAESLIKRALNDTYLDQLGEKFNLFTSPHGSPLRSREREFLAKRIEMLNLSETTYQIGFVANDPLLARDIAKDAMNEIIQTLVSERRKTITSLRDAIRKRIESMAFSKSGVPDAMASERVEILKQELESIQGQLRALRIKYTNQHPEITTLAARAKILEQWISTQPHGNKKNENPSEKTFPLIGGEPKEALNEVYQELVKKYTYLNITLDQEDDDEPSFIGIIENPAVAPAPMWPSKLTFGLWGLIFGILSSSLVMIAREFFGKSPRNTQEIARELNIPVLGSLPTFNWNLPDPTQNNNQEKMNLREWN